MGREGGGEGRGERMSVRGGVKKKIEQNGKVTASK